MKEARRWSVDKRLEFIDFRLFWEGQINRADIINQFKISVPQASKDLSLYQEEAPDNISYDSREKRYCASKKFKPVFFRPNADAYLAQLQEDVKVESGTDKVWLSFLPEYDYVKLPHRNVNLSILKSVVKAVRAKEALDVCYQSMSREEPTWRQISPHAFAFDGHRWHVRSFCHKDSRYKDFLLSRVLKIKETSESSVSGDKDKAWNEFFTVILKPHPGLSKNQKKAVSLDYDMKDMRLEVKVRLALLYYFLRRLDLSDCDGSGRSQREQHVVVANKAATKKALAAA